MGRMEGEHAKNLSLIDSCRSSSSWHSEPPHPLGPPTMIFSSTELSPEDFRSLTVNSDSPPATFSGTGSPAWDSRIRCWSGSDGRQNFTELQFLAEGGAGFQSAVPSGDPRLHVQKGLPSTWTSEPAYTAVPSTDISIIGGEINGRCWREARSCRLSHFGSVAPSCSADQKCTWKPIAPISRSARVFSSSSPTPVSDNCSQQPDGLGGDSVSERRSGLPGNSEPDERFRRLKIAPQ